MRSLVLLFAAVFAADPHSVRTQSGTVIGFANSLANNWLGIPYAEQPVGALRWQDPKPAKPWSTPMRALAFGPGCPQHCVLPPKTCPPTTNEGCLFLNVFTPLSSTTSSSLPVQFWIHGGKFEQGAGGSKLFDGSETAAKANVVVVTINYRLGALGFFASAESGVAGNFGIKDQQLALQWVAANIAAFGGDPARVMIYGQSSGGSSVSTHMALRSSWKYFNTAVLESAVFGIPYKDVKTNEGINRRFAKDLDCALTDAACLRGKPAEEIVAAQISAQKHISILEPLNVFFPWTPVADGHYLPAKQPLDLWRDGDLRPNTSVIMGNVANETLLFIFEAVKHKINLAELDAVLVDIFGPLDAVRIFREYIEYIRMWPDSVRLGTSFLSDHYIMYCPTRAAARGAAKVPGMKVFTYIFDHVSSFSKGMWGPNYTFCDDYVCHGEEIPFLWDTARLGGYKFTPGETSMSNAMIAAWSRLASHGAPTADGSWPNLPAGKDSGLPYWHWTASGPSGDGALEIDPHRAFCDFWDAIGYLHNGILGGAL